MMTLKSQAVTSVHSQDPDGIGWIAQDHWSNSKWDGIPFDHTGKTKEQLSEWLRPSTTYVVRGLRELFYEINPFIDIESPTPAEIDSWNIQVIKHFRNLLGVKIPVKNDARLYLESRWSDERKNGSSWDKIYPGTPGGPYGPCRSDRSAVDSAGGHCGESFFPSVVDRQRAMDDRPYKFNTYPELNGYAWRACLVSGISSVNADLPWSIKLAHVISQFIHTEGLSNHAGPFVNPVSARTNFGCSWWYTDGKTASFRGKWR